MKRSMPVIFALLLVFAMFTAGYAGDSKTPARTAVDYSNTYNWLRFGDDKSKAVDIFAVYPTVTFSEEQADIPYVRIGSPLMRKSAEAWFERVDGIITPSGNVYAPLYGQLNGAMLANLSSTDFEAYTLAAPREDVFAAFDYYLTHVNKGERPFILFGHSQGAALVAELATVFLGDEKYRRYNKNHIITYAVGYSVTGSRIAKNPDLKFSECRDDNGVIVSWNTTASSEIAGKAYKKFGTWHPEALVTNPISWTTDEILRHASANQRAIIFHADSSPPETLDKYANALVDMEHRVLVTTTVDESRYAALVPTIGKFHQHDIGFYHDSILQNIKDRIEAFKAR